jgi:hypothetical protein
LLIALLAGLVTYESGRAAYYGFEFLRASAGRNADHDTLPEGAPTRIQPFAVVAGDGVAHLLDLSHASGLVFIYDARCIVCGRTAPRWLELLDHLRGANLSVYAIASGPPSQEQLNYWAGLEERMGIAIVARDSTILEQFGTRSTPTTVVLDNGHPRLVFVGPLDRGRSRQVLSTLASLGCASCGD